MVQLNGYQVEKYLEAFGGAGGGGGGPKKIFTKTLALFGNHPQKAIKSKRR
ncbi:MAG: hypothetical protein H7296_12120 [Bacteroidia bacterium]|nr:hypothetical protein [Bacteroidia bacterium]